MDRESRNRQRHTFRERNARAAGSRYKYSRFTRVEGPDIFESNLSTTDFYVADFCFFNSQQKSQFYSGGDKLYESINITERGEIVFSVLRFFNVFHDSSFVSLPSSPLTDSPIFYSIHCLYMFQLY